MLFLGQIRINECEKYYRKAFCYRVNLTLVCMVFGEFNLKEKGFVEQTYKFMTNCLSSECRSLHEISVEERYKETRYILAVTWGLDLFQITH